MEYNVPSIDLNSVASADGFHPMPVFDERKKRAGTINRPPKDGEGAEDWELSYLGINKNSPKRKWLIISSTKPPLHGFTDQQIYSSLKRHNIKPFYIYEGQGVDLVTALACHEFETIYWEGTNGWKYWDQFKDYKALKVNTWFDDPCMQIDLVGVRKQMEQGRGSVKTFVWDSYWSTKMLMDYGIDSEELHLAASEDDFYTSNTACDKYPVFIGSLHSQQYIDTHTSPLLEPLRSMIKYVEQRIKTDKEIKSWDVYEDAALSGSGDGEKRLFKEICEMDPQVQFMFRKAIWAMSKNQVRINMLKAALEVTPVIMFSETRQLGHANEWEVKCMLGDNTDRLKFRDTSEVRSDKLGKFYHWSWINLQATDPQSVNTGFPYRMFQTQASGRVLLTDKKPQWNTHFNIGETMVGYDDVGEMKEQLFTLMGNITMCKEIGRKAREEFEQKHTWHHRLDKMIP